MRVQLRAWEGPAALLALGLIYGFVSERFTVGPPWLVLGILGAGASVMVVLGRRARFRERRVLALALMVQPIISLTTIVVFAARAINTLPS